MGGAVPGLALQQARYRVQQEPQQRTVGFGQVQRALQGPPGGARVAERVPGDRLQQERLSQPGPGLAERSRPGPARAQRSPRAGRPGRAAAPPWRCACPHVPVLVRRVRRGPARRARSHRGAPGCAPAMPAPAGRPGGCGEPPGQPLGGLEGGQRISVPAARQLQQPADVADPRPRRGLGFRFERCVRRAGPTAPPPPAVPARPARLRVSCRRCRQAGLVGPAVPLGQLDRLPGVLGRHAQTTGRAATAAWSASPVNSR